MNNAVQKVVALLDRERVEGAGTLGAFAPLMHERLVRCALAGPVDRVRDLVGPRETAESAGVRRLWLNPFREESINPILEELIAGRREFCLERVEGFDDLDRQESPVAGKV